MSVRERFGNHIRAQIIELVELWTAHWGPSRPFDRDEKEAATHGLNATPPTYGGRAGWLDQR